MDSIAEHQIDPKDRLPSCTILSRKSHVIVPNIMQLAESTKETVREKLRKSVNKYKQYLNGINEHVAPRIQRLFDDLSKQYQCEWKDNDAIYFPEFNMHIRSPYGADSCEGGSDEKAKQRVKHILTEFAAKSEPN